MGIPSVITPAKRLAAKLEDEGYSSEECDRMAQALLRSEFTSLAHFKSDGCLSLAHVSKICAWGAAVHEGAAGADEQAALAYPAEPIGSGEPPLFEVERLGPKKVSESELLGMVREYVAMVEEEVKEMGGYESDRSGKEWCAAEKKDERKGRAQYPWDRDGEVVNIYVVCDCEICDEEYAENEAKKV